MYLKKKTLVIMGMMTGITIFTAFTVPPNEFKNLKVLPKNISSKDLNKIMVDEFSDGLGATCGFCHAENKDTHILDYASDENPEKGMARKMMLMMNKINKHYFKVDHPVAGSESLVVSCYTCHRGAVYPVTK